MERPTDTGRRLRRIDRLRPEAQLTLTLVATLLLGISACARPNDLLILCTSSMGAACEEIVAAFSVENPEFELQLSVASSLVLAAQIQNGARADLFISASRERMDDIAEHIVTSSRQPIARSQLVVARRQETSNPTNLEELLALDAWALAPIGVPIGDYARRAVAHAKLELGDRAVEFPNEPAIAQAIARGSIPAGILYASSIVRLDGTLLASPLDGAGPIFEVASLQESTGQDAAQAFLNFIRAAQGQAILRAHGFDSPEPPS